MPQLAHLAVLAAAELWRPETGVSFTTYAVKAIRHRLANEAGRAGYRVRRLPEDMDVPARPPAPGGLGADEYARVAAAVRNLGGRHAEVVTAYYGLAGTAPVTLPELGLRLGVSYQRVQQLLQVALGQLARNLAADATVPSL
jgi:RNA polymerase sigma factor (sigma-70 family)